MKNFTRLTALLLCLCLIVGFAGCTEDSTPTAASTAPTTSSASTEPTSPTSTEPTSSASDVYAAALHATTASKEFSLEVSSVKTIALAEQEFTQSSQQSIYYTRFGTDSVKYRSTEKITYSKDHSFTYDEVYSYGTLYASLDQTNRFRSELTVEDAALRHLDPTMLDATLYGQITISDDGTILFENPTAAEDWAMPEDAELLQASGSATIDANGKLKNICYTISYLYGSTEVSLEVKASLLFDPITVNLPAEAHKYTSVQDVNALYLYANALGSLSQASCLTSSSLESIMSQAAGVVRNQSTTLNTATSGKDPIAKIETDIYLMDYSTNQKDTFKQEELFMDGKYTFATDDGDPVEDASVTADIITNYCADLSGSHMIRPEFWSDATVTDLGSTLLVELDLTDAYGNLIETSICKSFWGNGNFLRNLASRYEFNETSGYIALDKYTGLPTSGGYYFEETHTIDGNKYILTLQSDQAIDCASMEAYYNITEKLPELSEPKDKPTPLFYHVTGENGQEMWLLGTIHVGDVRTAYLPKEIYDAFIASDALALEINSKLFDEQVKKDDTLQDKISELYYLSDGKTLKSMMDKETYDRGVQLMKASGNYNVNAPYMKPYLWSQAIDNFNLRQGYALHRNYGVEAQLHRWAEELDKEIREVESSLFQIQMLSNYSDALQLQLLEDSMDNFAQEYWEDTLDLFEKWCQGDEATLRQLLNEEVDLSELTEEDRAEYEAIKPLIDEYNKSMNYDRNIGMLKVAISYLESKDVVFYAVGLAHLLDGTNGLVDALRAEGYTVELVTYA